MSGETSSPEQAASFVRSGMWLDYGAIHCQPDVFDKALAARKNIRPLHAIDIVQPQIDC